MRKFISSVIVSALLGGSQAVWYSGSSALVGGGAGDMFNILFNYDVPMYVTTTYYSGNGPYYSSDIFTGIDSSDHYEEYGVLYSLSADASLDFVIGDSTDGSAYYYFSIAANADILDITPYKQVIWW
jgi:hypothetical protein